MRADGCRAAGEGAPSAGEHRIVVPLRTDQRHPLRSQPVRFVYDFPGVAEMPLQLPPAHRAAFNASVKPLLELAEAAAPNIPVPQLAAALMQAVRLLEENPRSYSVLRGVADYVQCTFAQVCCW